MISEPVAESMPRLFIVDDELALMQALRTTLRAEGYETVGFTSAQAALEALRGTRCDLLLTDMMMPEMDGIALLSAAQQVDPALAGIIMTGQGTVARAVQAMKAGALDFILKPFNLSAILPVLTRALAVRSLRLRNVELEERVRGRTLELEAANKELESFSYSVSHDLRAPLRWIAGFADALMEDHAHDLSSEAQRKIGLIQKESHHMELLISGLLEFSRLGREDLQLTDLDMHALADKAWSGLIGKNGAPHPELHLAALPPARGDRLLLGQVWTNLLSNAVKFSAKREHPQVFVNAIRVENECIYSVRDNGAGFDPDYQFKLFGVFQRLHDSSEFPGNGVGLALVQRIVNRHGGRVWAEGRLNEGAEFFFSLPGGSSDCTG
ncbi:MAG: response regulator [Pseudomonadota bacterium]